MSRWSFGITLALCGCANVQTSEAPKNIILITMDTVRADHLPVYGYQQGSTPGIDAFAQNGAVFETAISVAPVTMPTHTSLLTGLYPYNHGVRNNGSFVLAEEQLTLAEHLSEQGYDTAAIISAMVLDSKFGLSQGFRLYDDDLSAGGPKKLFMFKETSAEVGVDKALALLDGELKEPFFLWLHLFDAHADYSPPPPYDIIYSEQPYDGEIAYLDRELNRLFSGLHRSGLDERTLVTLTADHGDSLGDHGETTHGVFIYRSTTHVPLIISGPGVKSGRVEGAVSQVDVVPTVLDWAGLPPMKSDGRSLLPSLRVGAPAPKRDGVYSESMNPRLHFGWHELRSLDNGKGKYIQAPEQEFYDMLHDPNESMNLWTKAPSSATRLKTQLEARIGADDAANLHLSEVDGSTAEMLEALGYVSGAQGSSGGELPDPKAVVHRWVNFQYCQAQIRLERWEDANECLVKVLADDPGNWTARMSMATTFRKQEKYLQALEQLDQVISEAPTQVKAYLSKAETLEAMGRVDEAVAEIKAGAAIVPNDPEPWTALGDLFSGQERPEDALEAFGQALKRDQQTVKAYVGVANILHNQGDDERAATYIERAIALDPSDNAAWYNKGVIIESLGRSAEAEAAYLTALELSPKHALTLNNLGGLLLRLGREGEAVARFKAAIEADATLVAAHYNLATVYLTSDPDRSIALFKAALRVDGALVPALHNIGLLLETRGDYTEALVYIGQLVKVRPGVSSALFEARLLVKAGRRAEARRKLAQLVKRGGDKARALVKRNAIFDGLL